MKKSQKKFIVNLTGIALMLLFVGGLAYLVIFNDPIVETEYDTKDPNKKLIVREHTKTGVKDYFYRVTDGIGSNDPLN